MAQVCIRYSYFSCFYATLTHLVSSEIDKIDGHDVWKLEPTFPGVYDADRLQDRLYQLREARTSHDLDLAMQTLRENLFRNLGSLSDPRLFNRCTVGTKKLVGSYLKEVVDTIDSIADSPLLSIDEREHFLADSRQAYGRTALLLSGGAAMGMMHWGVLKCLFQHGLLPPVLCGNSIGALFAAMLGLCLLLVFATLSIDVCRNPH